MLEVNQIHTYYGTSHILVDVSLNIQEGEIVYCLGRNGAGKTTTIRSIMGLTPPRAGSIKLRGEEIAGKAAFEIARRGVGYIPSGRRIYPTLTVRENLVVAMKPPIGEETPWTVERVYDMFPALKPLDTHRGRMLSGGELQMLAIARTLMGNPELLLMDEPSEGLSPLVLKGLGERIQQLSTEGITVFITEQNVNFALGLSSRGYIIDNGRIVYEGTVDDLQANEEIKSKYLAL